MTTWPLRDRVEQAAAMGETPGQIADHEHCPVDFVLRVFAHMDAAVHDELRASPVHPGQPCADCGRPMVPQGRQAHGHVQHRAYGRCCACDKRNRASRDEVAIQRAIDGQRPVWLTLAERGAVVAALTELGMSAAQIAERIGITARHVQKHRARLRRAAVDNSGVCAASPDGERLNA